MSLEGQEGTQHDYHIFARSKTKAEGSYVYVTKGITL